MFNDNFVVAPNQSVSFIKEVIDILVGIAFILLILKLIIFLVSYIYKAIKMVISTIFSEAIKPNLDNQDISSERLNRNPKYETETKNHSTSPPIPIKNIEDGKDK